MPFKETGLTMQEWLCKKCISLFDIQMLFLAFGVMFLDTVADSSETNKVYKRALIHCVVLVLL